MEINKLQKIVILCGGTGGHFYPGLTIARKFQENKGKAYLFIGGHLDKIKAQTEVAKNFNLDSFLVNSAKLSKNPFKLFTFSIVLLKNFLRARKILKQIKPDALLGMGSFTSLPAGLAAVSLNIPLFLHDGNAVVGKANLFLSRWTKLLMTAFPPVNPNKIKCEHIYSGMPVRPEFLADLKSKTESINEINKLYETNFDSKKQTVLIFGGSQGAATINRVMPEAIPKLNNKNIQIIHLFGTDQKENPYTASVDNSLILKSCDKIHLLYSAADLIISRCGGSTVAELLCINKPAILIPYPLHKDLQQKYNADFYLKFSNSIILLNQDCTPEKIKPLIEQLLCKAPNKAAQASCLQALPNAQDKDIRITDAAQNILQLIDKAL